MDRRIAANHAAQRALGQMGQLGSGPTDRPAFIDILIGVWRAGYSYSIPCEYAAWGGMEKESDMDLPRVEENLLDAVKEIKWCHTMLGVSGSSCWRRQELSRALLRLVEAAGAICPATRDKALEVIQREGARARKHMEGGR